MERPARSRTGRRSLVRAYLPALATLAAIGCGSPFATNAPVAGVALGSLSDAAPTSDAPLSLPPFSFFYTSLAAMQRLSGSMNGFGGNLSFGETGPGAGLGGADKICTTIAEASMSGSAAKQWRAFLSATADGNGNVVNAIDRVGNGPWYDRQGRPISQDRAGLLSGDRPLGDPAAVVDLPDETGNGTMSLGSTYDAITATGRQGQLDVSFGLDSRNTCMDWTSATIEDPHLICGHAWSIVSLGNWMSAHAERSCIPGVNLRSAGGLGDGSSIGAAGGWGGFYCFALNP